MQCAPCWTPGGILLRWVRLPLSPMFLPRCCVFLLLVTGLVSTMTRAEEPAVFTPPQAYPMERYEAGWNKNPFTLKTVPAEAPHGQFAADLTIGAYYGSASNPTVVLVNTKTRARIPLQKGQPGPQGMTLKSMKLNAPRSECQVEVTLGAESAVIKYDTAFLAQLSASPNPAGGNLAPVPTPGAAGRRPPGMPTPPAAGAARNIPAVQPARVSSAVAPVPMPAMPARPGAAR